MLPVVLLPETVSGADGIGPAIEVDSGGNPLLLTLEISQIVERESLDLSVWGSPDGAAWTELGAFPPKSYCGAYTLPLHVDPAIQLLRVQWQMGRWGKRLEHPLFSFQVRAQEGAPQTAGHSA